MVAIREKKKLLIWPNKDFVLCCISSNTFSFCQTFSACITTYPKYPASFPSSSDFFLDFFHPHPDGFNDCFATNWIRSFWNWICWNILLPLKHFYTLKPVFFTNIQLLYHVTILHNMNFHCNNLISFCLSCHI